jgi:hypothetical protein
VLVQDRRNVPHRGGEPAKGRRAVAVEMKHVGLLAVDDRQERRQRHRIELRSLEIRDVDAERFERFLREVPFPQADQRHGKACRVEARNHPAEEPLDAVHPRALPTEVIADLQDFQRSLAHRAVAGSRAIITGRTSQFVSKH